MGENIIDKAKEKFGLGGDKTNDGAQAADGQEKESATKQTAIERVQAGATPPKKKTEPKKETRAPGLYFTRNISSSMVNDVGVHKAGSRVPANFPPDELKELRKKHYIEEVK